jgi:hypothetical protein
VNKITMYAPDDSFEQSLRAVCQLTRFLSRIGVITVSEYYAIDERPFVYRRQNEPI